MICLLHALTRLPHLSHAAFLSHWREVHAPLIMSCANDLGIRRYLQIHGLDNEALTTLGVRSDSAPLFDGIAQVWFDNQSAALSARDTPAGKAAFAQVRLDEARFVDRERSVAWWGEPHVILS